MLHLYAKAIAYVLCFVSVIFAISYFISLHTIGKEGARELIYLSYYVILLSIFLVIL